MAARFTHTFYSLKGTKYIINLHDNEFTGTAATCELLNPGFAYSLAGQGDERHDLIKSSEVRIQMLIRNSTEEQFITDIVGATEQRFFIEIFRTNTSNRWWSGLLLQDLITIPDAPYTYEVELSFSDGISQLADVPYDDDGTLYSGRDTFIEHLIKCLSYTNTTALWVTDETFLETRVHYYDEGHVAVNAAKCPLQYSDVDHNAFKQIDSKTKLPAAITVLEVLEQICDLWGARLMLSNGRWLFEQMTELDQVSTARRFNKAGTYRNNYTANRFVSESAFTRSGGQYSFLPPLLEVKQDFNWRIGVDYNNLLPAQYVFDPAVEVCYVESNSTVFDYFNFDGGLRFYGTLPSVLTDNRRGVWGFEIAIETSGGTKYYFKNQQNGGIWDNFGTWSTGAGYFYVARGFPKNVLIYNVLHSMNFNTPQFPVDGDVTFKFVFIRIEKNENGTWVTSSLPPAATFTWLCEDYTLTIVELTNAAIQYISGTKSYTLRNQINNEDIKATLKVELNESEIGDSGNDTGYAAYNANRIKTSADLSTWVNSSKWAYNAVSTGGIEINRLRLLDYIIGQRLPLRVFTGALFYGSFTPEHVFTISTLLFYANGCTFNAQSDTVEGAELINISYDRDDHANVEVVVTYESEEAPDPTTSGGANPTDGGAMAGASEAIEMVRQLVNNLAITYTDTDISGSTSSLSVYRISKSALKSGDVIYLVTPSGQIESFTVSANQAADADSISVTTRTPSITIPAESAVVVRSIDIKNYFDQTPRITRTTSDPSSAPAAAGNIYINTTSGTIWVANGTASSSNWIQVNNLN